MIVNKIGSQHLELGTNCQDFGLEKDNLKLVCDGCSEGEHSEIGAKTYCYLANLGYTTHEIFEKLINMFGQSVTSIKNFLCFTIVSVIESNEFFKVQYCGDGYIVLEDVNGDIVFEELNDGEYPKYFAYNYCTSDTLKHYKDGVQVNEKIYYKNDFKRIGVATDGIRFIVNLDNNILKNEFIEILKNGNAVKLKRFINRNQKIFKDDITIVF